MEDNQNKDSEEKLLEPPEEEKLIPAHTESNKKGVMVKIILSLIGAFTLCIIAFAAYVFATNSSSENSMQASPTTTVIEPTAPPMNSENDGMVACTMDAKICPDGITTVGRIGADCEFAACPGE
jgi:hypothetical protein